MSFVISVRAGPRLATRAPQLFKSIAESKTSIRSFHRPAQSTFSFTPRPAAPSVLSRVANGSRGYQTKYAPVEPPIEESKLHKLLMGGAVMAGSMVAIHMLLNRDVLNDGGIPQYERKYLNSTFLHTGLGIGIIGLTARQMIKSGFAFRLMTTNPWVVAIGGLALSFGTMIGTRAIDPENYIPKYALWTAFNATQAAFIAPLVAFVPMPILARAGLYTVAMMGAISYIGATAKQDKYLYFGGPLLAGAAIVAVSGMAPLLIPATAVRALAMTEKVWLYGGLAVFGGFTLYHAQMVLHHARLAQKGLMKRDPVNEAISFELDFLNIFVRMVQILMMQQGRKK